MKLKHKLAYVMAIVMALQVLLPGLNAMSFAGSVDPEVHVDLTVDIQEVRAGEEARIDIPVITDTKTAKYVKVSVADNLDSIPFIFDDSRPWTQVEKVTPNGATPYFKVRVSPTAISKIYEIKVNIEYESLAEDKYTATDSIYIKVINDQIEPTLGVVDYKLSTKSLSADAGEQALVVTVGNTGTVDAKNVRVTLKGFAADGIHIDKGLDVQAIDLIEAKKERLTYFYLKPSNRAKSGEYQLEAEITYIDEIGAEYKRSSYIYLPVEGTDTKSIDMEFANLTTPDRIEAGQTFVISTEIANKSLVEAEYVDVSVDYPTGIVPVSKPKIILRDFKSQSTQLVSFELQALEDLKTNHYPINILATYSAEGDDSEATVKEYAGINVDGRSGLGRPKILIEDYSFDGDTVMAGEEFDLNLRFFNTSSDDLVKNIKVSVSSDDGVFSPVDSSSSFFIERIGKQDYMDYALKLETKRDAQVKTYNLKLIMEYEDGEGNAYDSQEQPFKEEEALGIPVSQPVRLESGDVVTPFESYVGNNADIELEFYNMGRAAMYNMFVKLEGDFRSQDGSYFVGNFEAGKSDYFSASIIPEAEGEVVGKVVFSFEDALGNPSTVEKEFSFFAAAPPTFDNEFEGEFPTDGEFPDGMNPNGEEEGSKTWMYLVGVLVVIGAVVIVIKRRKKKRLELLQALEDEDE